jgi:hypothetical protein
MYIIAPADPAGALYYLSYFSFTDGRVHVVA